MGERGIKRSREDDSLDQSSLPDSEIQRSAPKRARTGVTGGFISRFFKASKSCVSWFFSSVAERLGGNRQRGPGSTEPMTEETIEPIDMTSTKKNMGEGEGTKNDDDCVIIEEKIVSSPSPLKFGAVSFGPLGARQRQFRVSTKEKRLRDAKVQSSKSIMAQIKTSNITASKKPPAINSSWLHFDKSPLNTSPFKKKNSPFPRSLSRVGRSSIVKTPKIDFSHAYNREDHLKYSAILSGLSENVFPRPFLLQSQRRSLFHKEVEGTGGAVLQIKVQPDKKEEEKPQELDPELITLDGSDEDEVKILTTTKSSKTRSSLTSNPLSSRSRRTDDADVIEIVNVYSPPQVRKSASKSPSRISTLHEELQLREVAKDDYLQQLTEKYDYRKQQNAQRISEQKVVVKHSEDRCAKQSELAVEERLRMHLKLTEVAIPEPPTPESEPEELEDEEVILPPLTTEMENAIESALSTPDRVTLIDAYKIPITRNDLDTLRGLNWLNDEIINFYMQMIVDRSTKYDNWPTVYAVNTFFYPKLKQGGHLALKRWTRKVDIFAHDLILVPVHLGMHWCLATIDLKNKGVYYYDSMGGNNEECLRLLLRYLQDEHMDKKKTPFDVSNFSAEIVKDIPQQMNGSDCGMFTCKFAEYLSRNANITFSQENMPYFRRRMIYEITKNVLMYP